MVPMVVKSGAPSAHTIVNYIYNLYFHLINCNYFITTDGNRLNLFKISHHHTNI